MPPDTAVLDRDAKSAQILTILGMVKDIATKAEAEHRDFDDTERTQIQSLMAKATALKADVTTADGKADLNAQIAALGDGLGLVPEDAKSHPAVDPAQSPANLKARTVGGKFFDAKAYADWLKGFPNGQIPDGMKGITGPPIGFGGMENLGLVAPGQKNVVQVGDHTGSAGTLVYPQHLGLVDQGMFQRPLVIRDLITIGQTGTDVVDFVVEKSFTNNASVVAEATASSGTSGTKPESGFDLEPETANVRTIAHWIPATKRALSDAGQVRTLIDTFLTYGLDVKLEDEILTGDGTGQHLTGLAHTTGVQAQPWSAVVLTGGAGILETTRKAITKVQVNGRTEPTAFVFTPSDWEAIELQRMKLNPQYDFGGRMGRSLHGLPVVLSQGLTDGTGYVANWRYAVLWDREQAAIQVSDSHADFFVRNLVAFLAELRAAFGIFRPAAFCSIDLTA